MGRDLRGLLPAKRDQPFQSTLPAWGETLRNARCGSDAQISIHSPRMGRDILAELYTVLGIISIHSPRMGRDLVALAVVVMAAHISIHSPRMGRDSVYPLYYNGIPISIHSPRMGRDDGLPDTVDSRFLISIHSPRMGRDTGNLAGAASNFIFQSTLPAWGETKFHGQ